MRHVYGWMVVRVETLSVLSHYSRKTIERILPTLVEREWIEPLGRLPRGRRPGSGEELYNVGPVRPDRPPFEFMPRLRCKKWEPSCLHAPNGWVTSHGLIVPNHQYCVVETAAWVVRALGIEGRIPCLAFPEKVLRGAFRWGSEKKNTTGKSYFITSIPDAWLFFGGFSVRLEVQITETSTAKVQAVCENFPLKEPVLYVFTDHDLFDRFVPLLEKIPNLFLARYGNATDLLSFNARYKDLLNKGDYKQSWMRSHYAGEGFAKALLKLDAAELFHQNFEQLALYLRHKGLQRCS